MLYCQFCNRECPSILSLKSHEVRCKLNPNRKEWCSWRKGSVWNKGLTKETSKSVAKLSTTLSENYKNGKYERTWHHHNKETKELLSKMRSDYLASAKNAGGFRDVGWYEVKNIKDEKYTVRGLWEYNVALKLNELKIYWTKNHYLNYFIDNVKKIYNPDFYLPDQNAYIEVKGYFSEKDKIKMDAVLDQNPDIKIYFMQNGPYKNFITGKIDLNEVPIYQIGLFNSGYIRKGQRKINVEKNYCLVCGKEINRYQKYCSSKCSNYDHQKIHFTKEQLIDLLNQSNINQVAKKFNVSFNAIKRWIKKFDIDYKSLLLDK